MQTFHHATLAAHLTLTTFGWGYKNDYAQERADLMAAGDQVQVALDFINHIGLRQTINPRVSSYWLKHQCEHWTGYTRYVSNGAFICALIHRGALIRQDGPNVFCNLRKVRLRDLSHGWEVMQ